MFKKIGIIGGLSSESTVSYYLHITRTAARMFGGSRSPEIFIASVDLEQYHQWRINGQWEDIARHLALSADRLLAAGADFGLIATNTMHKVFHEAQAMTELPLLSIFDPLIRAIQANGSDKVGLLGTTTTMDDPFYARTLADQGIETVVPETGQQQEIHRIIVEELVLGVLRDESRACYLAVMDDLRARGAQGVILGCTEIPLLITTKDTDMPLYDTAILHADAALRLSMAR